MSTKVIDALKQRIFSGDIPSGQLISASCLADQLGVGRNPVREAMIALTEAGLVKRASNAGYLVVTPNRIELESMLVTRFVLECVACERFVVVARENSRLSLRNQHEDLCRAIANADIGIEGREIFFAMDFGFHLLIAKLAEVEFVSSTLGRIYDRLRIVALNSEIFPDQVGGEHEHILRVLMQNAPANEMERLGRTIEIRRAVYSHLLKTASRWSPTAEEALKSYFSAMAGEKDKT